MARNGSGTFNRLYSWMDERDAGNPIDSTKMDDEMDGMATALTDSLSKNGETTPTADLPMGSFKHTTVGTATARNQYPAVSQVQNGVFSFVFNIGGTSSEVTGVTFPTFSSYAVGQEFNFVAIETNVGQVTININNAGPRFIKKSATEQLEAGEIQAGDAVKIYYDGAQFQAISLYDKNLPPVVIPPDTDGWKYIAQEFVNADSFFEFFHDGIDNAGTVLQEDYSYRVEMDYLFGTDGEIPIFTLFENGIYRVGTNLYANVQARWANGIDAHPTGFNILSTVGVAGSVYGANQDAALTGYIEVHNAASTVFPTWAEIQSFGASSVLGFSLYTGYTRVANVNTTMAATKFQIAASAGNFASGRIRYYRRFDR